MALTNGFDRYHPPANLAFGLKAKYVTLTDLFKIKVLHKPQWDLFLPPYVATTKHLCQSRACSFF